MEIRPNGTRFVEKYKWEDAKNMPYDYEHKGLLSKIMSHKIVENHNIILQLIMQFYEKSLIFVMKYTDILKNFKNHHWKNR